MDDSFDLLSSMSPKINTTKKTAKKGFDKGFVALRKHIRRSSILDTKMPTLKNESLILIESSSTSSYSTASSNPSSAPVILNETPIIIPDSGTDEENYDKPQTSHNITPSNLSAKKVSEIEQWLTKVNSESTKKVEVEKTDISTCFTEVSAIFPKNSKAIAANSTFLDVDNKKTFDECFKTEETTDEVDYNSDDYAECEKLLDKLYGLQWRERKEEVLPRSEPRLKKPPKKDIPIKPPATEVKRKPSITYKNPYSDTERSKSKDLLQTLQSARVKKQLNSPWMARVRDLCDSDSSEDDLKVKTKIKLNFDENDEKKPFKKPTGTSLQKKNKENKENSDVNSDDLLSQLFKRNLMDFKKKNDKQVSNNNWRDSTPTRKAEKTPKSVSRKKTVLSKSSSSDSQNSREDSESSNDEDEEFFRKRKSAPLNKTVTGYYSFLASLSATVPLDECDISARIFRSNYTGLKTKLADKLFKLFNETVFSGKLPAETPIVWNVRMQKTAGFCRSKKVTKNGQIIDRKVEIELSTKILDSPDRLRDTLVHEMCHAATWMINHVSDGHGQYWKSWAFKAMKTYPELPPIKRCHSYKINTKYTYKCTMCGYSIGRHTKSLDIERKRCGYCMGKFEVFLNKVNKNGEKKVVVATPGKKTNGFALFVKENYSKYRTPNLKHGDVMKILGQKFSALKVES